MQPEVHTNPFTGEKFTREAADEGVVTIPKQFCFATNFGDFGKTCMINLNEKPDNLVKFLDSTAKGLSQMTGRKVEFIDGRDNCCSVWGDYGFFLVRDPIKFTEGSAMVAKRT